MRGARPVEIAWGDLDDALAPGPHGPRLALLSRTRGPVVIDGHHIGSDPAVVAAVIRYYLNHPAQRGRLDDGADSIRAVEAVSSQE